MREGELKNQASSSSIFHARGLAPKYPSSIRMGSGGTWPCVHVARRAAVGVKCDSREVEQREVWVDGGGTRHSGKEVEQREMWAGGSRTSAATR